MYAPVDDPVEVAYDDVGAGRPRPIRRVEGAVESAMMLSYASL